MDERWEEVYAAHYGRLVELLTVVTGSRVDAEEVVQEAFVRGLGLTGRRPVPADPQAWLYRVAVNLARSRWRRLRAGRRVTARLSRDGEPSSSAQGQVDSRVVLLTALRRLPFQHREVLALHYLADLSVGDIAVRTGHPVGTVKARLSRARDTLARLLADDTVIGRRRGE